MAILVESIVLCMLFSIPSIMMLKDPMVQIHNYPLAIIERAIVNIYDVVVPDILIFCCCRRFVLPGTEDMVKDYHDYWFHIKGGWGYSTEYRLYLSWAWL